LQQKIIDFLEKIAKENSFNIIENVSGKIVNNHIITNGVAVYGILVESSLPLKENHRSLPGSPNLYPVYWGVDPKPISRILAHLSEYKKTGSVQIHNIKELENKPLYSGVIFLKEYKELEALLHKNFPPYTGKPSVG